MYISIFIRFICLYITFFIYLFEREVDTYTERGGERESELPSIGSLCKWQ